MKLSLKRRLRQVPYRKKVVAFSLAFVIAGVSLLFSFHMSRLLQHKEMNEMALWSFAMERIGESAHNDPIVYQVIHNQKIPYILTDESGRIEKSHLIPEKALAHPDIRMKTIMRLARQNQPIEINTPRNGKFILFY
ncbi:MAG: hypothetical protein IKD05_07680, partial [Tidjanibacter sp.]|nr:hypothetical protein [Tidjanibacter sp.]